LTWRATVCAQFEALAGILTKIEVFWDVMRGRPENSYCMTQCLVYRATENNGALFPDGLALNNENTNIIHHIGIYPSSRPQKA
jgi:hypothetical protein